MEQAKSARGLLRNCDTIRQLAQLVVAVLDSVVAHDRDPHSGLGVLQRLSYRPGGDHLQISVPGQRVAVIVTGDEMPHSELAEQRKVPGPALARDVEILVGLIGVAQEPGVMLKDHDVPRALAACALQLSPEPALL